MKDEETIRRAARNRFPNSDLCRVGFEDGASWVMKLLSAAEKEELLGPKQAALSTDAEPVKTAQAVAVKALQDAADFIFSYAAKLARKNPNRDKFLTLHGELLKASALSAQVQDVAGDPDALFWRIRIAYLRGAEWRDQMGSMEMAEKASYDYADKITSPLPASPAPKHGEEG